MDIQLLDIDKLQSYEDRKAVMGAIHQQISPPSFLLEIHEMLFNDSLAVIQNHSSKSSGTKKILEKALTQQFKKSEEHVVNIFNDKVSNMLSWIRRLNWTSENKEWRPDEWLHIAQKLNVEEEFIQKIIELSPSTSWKTWQEVLALDKNWEKNWLVWEKASLSAPVIANRWVDSLLEAMYKSRLHPQVINSHLGRTRGNNWFRLFIAKEQKRSCVSFETLEKKLTEKINGRLFNNINYTGFFITPDNRICLDRANQFFHDFLLTCPDDAKRWLSSPRNSRTYFVFKDVESADAQFIKYLTELGLNNEAGPQDIRALLYEWQKHTEGEGKLWDRVFSESLYQNLGLTRKPMEIITL